MPEFPGYRIERELGRGAMAVVYLATQLSLKRPVALKVLDRSVEGYAGMAQRFIQEAHTLAGLQHRNIVHVYDVVESEQGDFISMEYLVGGGLGDRLALGLTVQQSLAILAQLGSALDTANRSGVVHRDIKPENVLFRDADTPVLADFGIARELKSDSRMTQDGLVLGTPSYMAPEQISGDPIDGRADQYSLGAMFFQMLSGHVPYEADSTTNLLYAHMARAIPELPPALSALQPVINRMLAKSPDARYPDMAAMLLDVSRNLLHAPDLLRSPPGAPQVSATERLHQLGFLTTGMHVQQAADATQVIQTGRTPAARKTPALSRRSKGIRIGVAALVVLAVAVLGFAFRGKFQDRAEVAASPVTPAIPAPREEVAADNSIAVLPFVSMSADKDQEYFADGISEELLNQLAKIPQLRVIARTSSFSYKGKEVKVEQIARELDVAHILEGSIRKSGNKLRITAQLIRTKDSSHLWSETYDRELTDIFAVQDEISAAVVDQLKLKLLGGAPKARAVNPEAYALRLQARETLRQGTLASVARSIVLLKQALALDPAYSEGWTALCSSYMTQAQLHQRLGEGASSLESIRLARAAVNKALAADPDFAAGHANLGQIAMSFDGDTAAAAQHVGHALALDPDNRQARFVAASLLGSLGRVDEQIALYEAIVKSDPASTGSRLNLGIAYKNAGRFDEAIDSFRKALSLSPNRPGVHEQIAEALLLKGEPRAALAEVRKEAKSVIHSSILMPMIWHALGDREKAEDALATLIRQFEKEASYNIAYVQAYLGHADLAFEWLDKAVEYSDPGLTEVKLRSDLFANISKDPRWLPFLRTVGRAPEQLAAIKFEVPGLGPAVAQSPPQR